MQPLKHCQQAKQWTKDDQGMYHPCLEYPNCKDCPPKLSSDKGKKLVCDKCGAITMSLWEIDEPEKMAAPDVRYADFEAVMRSSGTSFFESTGLCSATTVYGLSFPSSPNFALLQFILIVVYYDSFSFFLFFFFFHLSFYLTVSTVAPEELKRFVEWTSLFGQEGA
jgi:hypothetical protein